MGQITTQLGHLFAQSIPTAIFVLLLLVFLDRLFFRPLSQTLDARAKATDGALAEARQRAAEAEEKLRGYERAIQAARQEIYHHREEARNRALGEREQRLQGARAHAQSLVKDAKVDLNKETAVAKVTLKTAVDSLASEVTNSFFSPRLPKGGQGGARV